MIKMSQTQMIELFEKYKEEINQRFIKKCEEDGYKVTESVSEYDMWDTFLCEMVNDEFIENAKDNLENSIGLESIGFEYSEE